MPDLATALKKQAPTASLAGPSTCLSIWLLRIFTPSRFKTGWVISVCPLFFLIQGWWELCPSDYLCSGTAQELHVPRSWQLPLHSTSITELCLSFTHTNFQFGMIFFSPLLNIISLQVIVVHISITGKVHNLTIHWYSAWTTENKRFQDCSTFFGGICSSVSDSCHFCLWRLISLWPSLSVFEPMEGIAVLPGNQTTLITYFWFNIKPLKYINTTILVHCLHSY